MGLERGSPIRWSHDRPLDELVRPGHRLHVGRDVWVGHVSSVRYEVHARAAGDLRTRGAGSLRRIGPRGLDDYITRDFTRNIGAEIMGRNKFGPQRGPWENLDWKGWWGDTPPFRTPVFVLTHHQRPSFSTGSTSSPCPAPAALRTYCSGGGNQGGQRAPVRPRPERARRRHDRYRPVRSRCLHPGQQQGRRLPSSSPSWV